MYFTRSANIKKIPSIDFSTLVKFSTLDSALWGIFRKDYGKNTIRHSGFGVRTQRGSMDGWIDGIVGVNPSLKNCYVQFQKFHFSTT